jgi:hypothetical protein
MWEGMTPALLKQIKSYVRKNFNNAVRAVELGPSYPNVWSDPIDMSVLKKRLDARKAKPPPPKPKMFPRKLREYPPAEREKDLCFDYEYAKSLFLKEKDMLRTLRKKASSIDERTMRAIVAHVVSAKSIDGLWIPRLIRIESVNQSDYGVVLLITMVDHHDRESSVWITSSCLLTIHDVVVARYCVDQPTPFTKEVENYQTQVISVLRPPEKA